MLDTNKVGKITWADVTAPHADNLRDFYNSVAGWRFESVDMGGYSDYSMLSKDGTVVAGVCHQLGVNADLPPQWLIYITVENLDQSMSNCVELGGEIISGPTSFGDGRFCVIRDPAGAVAALYQEAGA